MLKSRLTAAIAWVLLAAGAWQPVGMPAPAVVTLDPATTYQTMTGWQTSAQAGQIECNGFEQYHDQLFDQAIYDLGLNRVTVAVRAGAENPVDYFTQYVEGQISRADWQAHWYDPINDNDDPLTAAESGFHFSEADDKMDRVILPLRERARSRGEDLGLVLVYVDFRETAFEHRDSPEEYAELIAAAFLHLQAKYGWTPDLVDVILEPDNKGAWSGKQVGQALVAAGRRLADLGFAPRFIAPSTLDMTNAVRWFDEMIQVPGVLDYLSELSYHRYGGVSADSLRVIGERAVQYDIKTSMLEHIASGYEDLHQDLKVGRVSAWMQFTLAYCAPVDNGGHYYRIVYSNGDAPVLVTPNRTLYLRQYFKYIRRGAVRIGAQADDADLDPLAFINPDGGYVVVVKAEAGSTFSVEGLPPGVYEAAYTTAEEAGILAGPVVIGPGQALAAAIPQTGVITVYAAATAVTPVPTVEPTPEASATSLHPSTPTAPVATPPTIEPTLAPRATTPETPAPTVPVDRSTAVASGTTLIVLIVCVALIGVLLVLTVLFVVGGRPRPKRTP